MSNSTDKKRVLFIDRDGTLIVEPQNEPVAIALQRSVECIRGCAAPPQPVNATQITAAVMPDLVGFLMNRKKILAT